MHEGTSILLKSIDQAYSVTTDAFRNASQNSDPNTVVRDVYTIFKKVLRRMHRLNGTWKTMHHGVFAIDDDEMGNTRVIVATDVTFVLTNKQHIRLLMSVDTIPSEKYLELATFVDPTDAFIECVAAYNPTIMDDTLIASNYIGHADAIGYKIKSIEQVDLDDGDKGIEVIMVKRDRGIKLVYNMSTPFRDVTQLVNHQKGQN